MYFFIQHNYENAYASSTKNWDIVQGAIDGSSNLDIPNWLNWFLADIIPQHSPSIRENTKLQFESMSQSK